VSLARPLPVVVVSPHLDDAVLSCGGTIHQLARNGHRVVIVTVFSGEPTDDELPPLARRFHDTCDLEDDAAIRIRREEDRAACSTIGATPLHLPFLECIYRRQAGSRAPVYRVEESILGPPSAADAKLPRMIAKALRALPVWDGARIAIPLGIGRHVDHGLVRRAAEAAAAGSDAPRGRLCYYEDQPYACWNRDPSWPEALTAGLVPVCSQFDRRCWEAKITAIGRYRSQVGMLWPDDPDWATKLERYALCVSGSSPQERLWVAEGP
jgi:LmbE family N-acetylglucosaminyl deacetylase